MFEDISTPSLYLKYTAQASSPMVFESEPNVLRFVQKPVLYLYGDIVRNDGYLLDCGFIFSVRSVKLL